MSVIAASGERWQTAILPVAGHLRRNWSFIPGRPSIRTRLARLTAARRAASPPRYRVDRPVTPADRWNCLFLFCPQARLDPIQAKLLDRARGLRGKLLVVIALPGGADVPKSLDQADALVRKDLGGYDFSAYRIALALVADRSPGARVYLQNDSVIGPLVSLDSYIDAAPWDLTGFIAAPVTENHISSFALALGSVTPERLAELAPAIPGDRSYDRFADVVTMQETQLARIAAQRMSVGAYWYIADRPPEPSLVDSVLRRVRKSPAPRLDLRGDPMLGLPRELLRQGFPFVKRSLFGKFAGSPDTAALAAMLRDLDWPVDRGTI